MAVNGINGYGSYGIGGSFLNYQSSINALKLQQALGKTNSIKGSNATNGVAASLSEGTKFVSQYNSSMSDLMSAANSLRNVNSSGVMNTTQAVSSNTDVLTAEKNYSIASGTYEVNVEQLAQAQMNMSQGLASSQYASGDAKMAISTARGNIDVNVSATKADGALKTNKELLSDVAKAINSKSSDVTASIVEKDGKTMLKIRGNATGEANGFTVSGDFANQNGLTTATQEAQNAVYSVKENGGEARTYNSSTNDISLGYGKFSATLKSEGSSTVSIGTDNSKVVSAMEKLVESYNSAISLLDKNSERGSGAARQLQKMVSNPASEKSMEMVGVTVKKDGTLSLDKDKLKAALEENQEFAKDIIGGSFGIAQGAYNKAQSGLSVSSTSLISNDIADAKLASVTDQTNFLANYSRSGAYNTMNYYAVGMMMNFFA